MTWQAASHVDPPEPGTTARFFEEGVDGRWRLRFGSLVEFDADPPGAFLIRGRDGRKHLISAVDTDAELEFHR